jgi:hypothetical protein
MHIMVKKKNRKLVNKGFPEGAISAGTINKINNIYLSRVLDDDDMNGLAPVIEAFSEGKILEFAGQMKKARQTFRDILKKDPSNKWAMEALQGVELNLH